MERGARRLLGYPPEEIVGRPAGGLLAEEPDAGTVRSLKTLPRWNGQVALRHRDGHRLTVNLLAHHREPDSDNGAGEGDGDGGWFLVCALTHRPSPAQDDALLKWAFAESPAALALYDTGLRMRLANTEMERVVGLSEETMRGLLVSEIVAGPWSIRTERLMRRVLETGRPDQVQVSPQLSGHQGESVWTLSLVPVRGNGGTARAVLVVGQDTTEEHLARERLALLNEASVRIGSSLDLARSARNSPMWPSRGSPTSSPSTCSPPSKAAKTLPPARRAAPSGCAGSPPSPSWRASPRPWSGPER